MIKRGSHVAKDATLRDARNHVLSLMERKVQSDANNKVYKWKNVPRGFLFLTHLVH